MAPLTAEARRPVTILLVILILVASALALRSQLNANEARAAFDQSEANVVAIQANTDRLEKVVHGQCEQGQEFAHGINAVLDTLIVATNSNSLLTPIEKSDRTRRYEATKVKITVCKEP